MDGRRKARIIIAAWALGMLAMLGFMIAELVNGYPQVLAMIIFMVIATWVAGQSIERIDATGD